MSKLWNLSEESVAIKGKIIVSPRLAWHQLKARVVQSETNSAVTIIKQLKYKCWLRIIVKQMYYMVDGNHNYI